MTFPLFLYLNMSICCQIQAPIKPNSGNCSYFPCWNAYHLCYDIDLLLSGNNNHRLWYI